METKNLDPILTDLGLKVAEEVGAILQNYSGVVRAAKEVVRLRYSQTSWEELDAAIAQMAEQLQLAQSRKSTSAW